MVKYILKRLAQSLLTLLIIISVVFLLMRLMPTDYFFTEDELIKLTDAQKHDKLENAGLLDPPLVQLKNFYANMFKLDYIYGESVQNKIGSVLSGEVLECVHTAVESAVNGSYTDASAAAKEIDKINNKVLTEKTVSKLVDSVLSSQGEDLALSLSEQLQSKLSTLYKDAKKAIGDDEAAKLQESLTASVQEGMNALCAELAGGGEVSGFQNILNHLNPANYRLTFSLGNSYRIQHGISVITVIGEKFPISMIIGLCSLGLALVVGVVIGILQARFKDTALDHIGTGYTIFINAVPHLVSYTLIMYICARAFGLPMTFRSNTPVESAIPPILCLATASIASYMLWMRRYMVDELNKDYIRLAELKGLSRTQVMFRHVMKNAFLPLAQYLPYNILLTVGGSLLAESFFSVPGMGPLLTLAISRYDTNLVQAIVLLYAALGIMGVFLGDLLMGLFDPRISLVKKGGTR